MNLVIIAGNAGEVKAFASKENKVLRFSLAVDNGKDQPTWIQVVVFGGSKYEKYLTKGRRVLVTGRLAQGQKGLEVVARSIEFLDKPKTKKTEEIEPF